nr:pentatricopeptide repeat-containing protein At3g24000, mitochondrial [Tanacetum cinerariifolium]
MREQNEQSNYITLVHVLSSCVASNHLIIHGMPLHAFVIRLGFDLYDYEKNSLITMYSKCKDLNSSARIFDGLLNKDYFSWNAMVAANAHHGNGEHALKTFSEMIKSGILLDHFSFSATLTAAANLSTLEESQQDHGPNTRTHVMWNILISAYARQGSFQDAQDVFHEMLNNGLKPNHVNLFLFCLHVVMEWGMGGGLRVEMESSNVKKKPACSWIKLKRKTLMKNKRRIMYGSIVRDWH